MNAVGFLYYDISNSKLDIDDLIGQFQKFYFSKSTKWVDKIIVKKNNEIVKIFIRK